MDFCMQQLTKNEYGRGLHGSCLAKSPTPLMVGNLFDIFSSNNLLHRRTHCVGNAHCKGLDSNARRSTSEHRIIVSITKYTVLLKRKFTRKSDYKNWSSTISSDQLRFTIFPSLPSISIMVLQYLILINI